MTPFKSFLAAGALARATLPAFAGEQYVDPTGFAVSGYDVTSYFDLAQAPVGSPQPAPLPGRADITADWNGATWAQATPTSSPSARASHSMGSGTNGVVLFGGLGQTAAMNDTWTWDGTQWTAVTTSGSPSERHNGSWPNSNRRGT